MKFKSNLLTKEVIKYDSFEDNNHWKPVSISWHNIQVFGKKDESFSIFCRNDSKPKEILRKVSGEVKAGQLLAILGSSGAGKTTLLNVLTARNSSKLNIKGVVKLNGQTVRGKTIRSVSSYVQQNDLFIPLLTVREHLVFQALLKMDPNLDKTDRNDRIFQLMHKFNLMKCSETRIANISGGESKRLSFATEVMTDPSIMFCDEPTSGLDSYMAKNIITSLKGMAAEGRTVICTIHQPSSQVFELFEHLLLLADGRVAYMGRRVNAIKFFSTLGYNCPKDYNPADYYMDQLALVNGAEEKSKAKIKDICDYYKKSNFGSKFNKLYIDSINKDIIKRDVDSIKNIQNKCLDSSHGLQIDEMDIIEEVDEEYDDNSMPSIAYRTGRWRQFWTLLWRSFTTSLREPNIIKLISISIGLLIGSDQGQSHVQNINGALFILMLFVGYTISNTVIGTFCKELPLFLTEHHNRMYSVGTYFLSKIIAEFPIFLVIPLMYVTSNYYLIGFHDDFNTFLMTLLISILMTNCGVAYGYMISCISGSIALAASITQPLMMFLLFFSGYYLNLRAIPKYFSWIKYLSWFNYGYEALVVNQWKDIDYISCETNQTNVCYKTGKQVIEYLALNENNLNMDLIKILILTITMLFISYFVLFIRAMKK